MLNTLRHWWAKNIILRMPPRERELFGQEIYRINIGRMRPVTVVAATLQTVILIVGLLNVSSGELWDSAAHQQQNISYCVLIGAWLAACAVSFYCHQRIRRGDTRPRSWVQVMIITLSMSMGILVTFADLAVTPAVSAYFFALITILTIFSFPAKIVFCCVTVLHTIFCALLILLHPDAEMVRNSIINTTVAAVVLVFANHIFYVSRAYAYMARMELEERNEQLTNINEQLASVNDQLYQLSYYDALTQVANRKHLEMHLQVQLYMQASDPDAWPLGIFIVDIDYFKPYNDFYGHVQGDARLKQVAALLQEATRTYDGFVCRYGGEEFVLVIPDCLPERIERVARDIFIAIHASGIPHAGSLVSSQLTLSLGALSYRHQEDVSIERIIAATDYMLYQAKQSGRSRIVYPKQALTLSEGGSDFQNLAALPGFYQDNLLVYTGEQAVQACIELENNGMLSIPYIGY